MPVNEVNRIV